MLMWMFVLRDDESVEQSCSLVRSARNDGDANEMVLSARSRPRMTQHPTTWKELHRSGTLSDFICIYMDDPWVHSFEEISLETYMYIRRTSLFSLLKTYPISIPYILYLLLNVAGTDTACHLRPIKSRTLTPAALPYHPSLTLLLLCIYVRESFFFAIHYSDTLPLPSHPRASLHALDV